MNSEVGSEDKTLPQTNQIAMFLAEVVTSLPCSTRFSICYYPVRKKGATWFRTVNREPT